MRETKNIMEYEIELRKLLNEKKSNFKIDHYVMRKNGQNDDFKSCVIISSKQIKTFVFLTSGLYHKIKSHQIRYRETKK